MIATKKIVKENVEPIKREYIRGVCKPDGSIMRNIDPLSCTYDYLPMEASNIEKEALRNWREEPLSMVPFHNKADVPYIRRFIPQEKSRELFSIHFFKDLPKNVPEYCESHKHEFNEQDTFVSLDCSLKVRVQIKNKVHELLVHPYLTLNIPAGIRHSINVISGEGFMVFNGESKIYSGTSDKLILRSEKGGLKSRGIDDYKGKLDVYEEGREEISRALDQVEMGLKDKIGKAKTTAVIKMFEKASREADFIPSISPLKSLTLSRELQLNKAKEILEIGTLFGYSSIIMAISVPKKGHITTIEQNSENVKIARRAVEMAGLRDKITILEGNALEIIPKLSKKFDMAFIDAQKDAYLRYLKLIEPNLKEGGLIVADNVRKFSHYMKDYLRYVRNSGKYNSDTINTIEEEPFGNDAMEISIKNSFRKAVREK